MRTFITDCDLNNYIEVLESDYIPDNECNNCMGCFNCWTKSKYTCIMKDNLSNIGTKLLQSDSIYIITKLVNGCYSSKVKKIIERSINFIQPNFVIRGKYMHHYLRINKKIPCTIIVYGTYKDDEKNLFEELVKANNLNFYNLNIEIKYIDSIEQIGDLI